MSEHKKRPKPPVRPMWKINSIVYNAENLYEIADGAYHQITLKNVILKWVYNIRFAVYKIRSRAAIAKAHGKG